MAFIKEFVFDEAILGSKKIAFHPSQYLVDSALHNAVKVAVMLKQPLLLTGEPGTGKTRLAEKLAADLHRAHPDEYLSEPLTFHTKTVSSYTDLFYTYDALSHFHDAHLNHKSDRARSAKSNAPKASRYIRLQALGQAIVLSNEQTARASFPYAFMEQVKSDKTFTTQALPVGPRSSVVLVDEVDKAQRDFTNDLLNELDRFEFSVKEDHNALYRKGSKNIFLILTSNSERNLPDAFLRRCLFHHIKFPDENQLRQIVLEQVFVEESKDANQLARIQGTLAGYVGKFKSIREQSVEKKPATAELISWIYYLKGQIANNVSINALSPEILHASYAVISKNKTDFEKITRQ